MLKSIIMCSPMYISGNYANNIYMEELVEENGKIDVDIQKAINQYSDIKKIIEKYNVDIKEIPPAEDCQDQVYTANIGVYLGNNNVLLANFLAPGRKEEEKPALEFFTKNNFNVIQPPPYFEGEADFKYLRDNIYFGAYGIRTSTNSLYWISEKFNIKIIPVSMTNEYLYHLDCVLFPIDEENVIVTKEGTDLETIERLGKYANLIFTPPEFEISGITNAVKLEDNKVIITHYAPSRDEEEKARLDWMNDVFTKFGYNLETVVIDEFEKSGALLSCCTMSIVDR